MSVRSSAFLIVFLAFGSVANAQVNPPVVDIMRGDANGDGKVNAADMVFINNWLFNEGPCPPCMDAADVNDDGRVNVADLSYLQTYLYMNGPAPLPPFPYCGHDPTSDYLSCNSWSCP
jgi:Dockerin type I domain